jgi:hypothetical protein
VGEAQHAQRRRSGQGLHDSGDCPGGATDLWWDGVELGQMQLDCLIERTGAG